MHAFLAIAVLAAAPDASWPAFRGDGTSVARCSELPLTWSDTEGVAWQCDLEGYGQSSPVVFRGRVYVTTVRGESKDEALVTCVSLVDGKQLWRREFAAAQKIPASDYVSLGAPTPVVDARGVYAFFESGDLVALDHEGRDLWHRKLTADYGEFKGNHGVGASLAHAGDVVIVLVDHDGPSYLLAIDKATGKNRWKLDRPAKVSWSSPIVVAGNEPEVVVSSAGTVEGFRIADGKLLWSWSGVEGNTVPSATVTEKLVIVGSGDAGNNIALRRGTSGTLTDEQLAWRLKEAAVSFSSPLAYGGRVYLVNRAGVAFCCDEASGKTLWTERLGGSCWASPIGGAGRIYFFGKDGVTTVVAAKSEFEKLAENHLTIEGRIYGVAAIEGAFVLRTGKKLFCVGKPLQSSH